MHSTKSENLTSPASPNGLKNWILAARPKTLIAGISPVLIGTALASMHQSISFPIALLCLLFSVMVQIGTNWANDYFDFLKGADTIQRKGPPRAVQSGWIRPQAMRNGAAAAFLMAACFAIPLLARIGALYLPLMILALLCGIFYTGGKKPLGYLGFGEVLVFFFYGPVATCCTALTQLLYIPREAWIASLVPGCLSCVMICINNLRDAEEDRNANKNTLIARWGNRFGQWEIASFLLMADLASLRFLSWTGVLIPLFFTALLLRIVFSLPEQLNRALALTGLFLAVQTLLILYATLSL